ncbi:MAG: hypothetical protein AMXMBFR57_26620 [Acidimicrobiia bacterium]
MAVWRAISRLMLIGGWTIVSPAWAWRRRSRWLPLWSSTVMSLMGVRLEWHGRPAEPGSLIVANHLGYLDVLAMATRCDTTFIAKAEIARWPIIGSRVRAAGTIFIERERLRDLPRVMEEMRARVRDGRSVMWFPEATSTDGRQVLPFKSGLMQVAVSMGLPITTVSLSTTGSHGRDDASRACWYGDQSLVPHLWKLLQAPETRFYVRVAPVPVTAESRKALARSARERVIAHR